MTGELAVFVVMAVLDTAIVLVAVPAIWKDLVTVRECRGRPRLHQPGRRPLARGYAGGPTSACGAPRRSVAGRWGRRIGRGTAGGRGRRYGRAGGPTLGPASRDRWARAVEQELMVWSCRAGTAGLEPPTWDSWLGRWIAPADDPALAPGR